MLIRSLRVKDKCDGEWKFCIGIRPCRFSLRGSVLTEAQKRRFAGILRWIRRCTVGRQHVWTFLFHRLTHAQTRPYSNTLLFKSNFSTRSKMKCEKKLRIFCFFLDEFAHLKFVLTLRSPLTVLFHLNLLNCVFA